MSARVTEPQRWFRVLAPWLAPAALVSVWELLSRAGVLSHALLPACRPSAGAGAAGDLVVRAG